MYELVHSDYSPVDTNYPQAEDPWFEILYILMKVNDKNLFKLVNNWNAYVIQFIYILFNPIHIYLVSLSL